MNGESPLEKLRELGWDLPDEFACFPVILLDEVAVIWASKGGHDVLEYYKGLRHETQTGGSYGSRRWASRSKQLGD